MSNLQRELDRAFARNAEAEAVVADLHRQVELAQAQGKPTAEIEVLKKQLATAQDTSRGTWRDINDIREAMRG